MGLEMTPETEVGAEGLVAHVADEGFHRAQQLLVPLQLPVCCEHLSTFLTGPQASLLAGAHFPGGGIGLRHLLLSLLHGLFFDMDFQLLRKTQVFRETGGIF
jgi:hypothetical protein